MSLLYLHLAKVRSYIESGTKKAMTLLCGGPDAPQLDRHAKKQAMSCWPIPLPVLLLKKGDAFDADYGPSGRFEFHFS